MTNLNNAPAGKVSADDLAQRISEWQTHYASCAGNCQQGRKECQDPEGCTLPEDGMYRHIGMYLCCLSAAIVCFAGLAVLL